MTVKWWVYIGGEVSQRTYSKTELNQLQGFGPETQVMREDDDDWIKAADDPELESLFSADRSSEASNSDDQQSESNTRESSNTQSSEQNDDASVSAQQSKASEEQTASEEGFSKIDRSEEEFGIVEPRVSNFDFSTWTDTATNFFRTILQKPGKFFEALDPGSSYYFALYYAVLVNFVVTTFTVVVSDIMQLGIYQTPIDQMGEASILGILMGLIVFIPFVALGIYIGAGLLHLILLVFGWNKESFAGTFKIVAYSSTATVGSLIPYLGGVVTLIWAVVLEVMGIQSVHKLSTGKALIAIFLPMILVIGAVGAIVFLGMGLAFLG